jgi:outer membrane protein
LKINSKGVDDDSHGLKKINIKVKNLSLALNVVLIIAVGVLYYLHFSSCSVKPAEVQEDTSSTGISEMLPEIRTFNGAIAYINYDSLTEKYEFFKQGVRDLESAYKRKEQEFNNKQQVYQEEVERYQQLAPSLTMDARETRERQLMAKQEELIRLGEKLRDDLKNKEDAFNKEFLKSIDDFLSELNKEKKYSYIFTYSKGGPAHIVFANDSLEITNEVIAGLNKAYKNKKSKK